MTGTSYRVFAQTSPGLEPLLLQEILGFGLEAEEKVGGVELRSTPEQLWTLCLRSRLAESVRVRLKSFVARDFHGLELGLSKLPFHAYLRQGQAVAVKVTCHRSRLWHTGAVAERVVELLERRVGVVDGHAKPGAVILSLRITGDAVQVSVDAGGYRLHRRGYRSEVAKASLRETLAAAVVLTAHRVAGEDPAPVIWDPFAGAGTLGIEAAHWARGRLAGAEREFSFQAWPTFDPQSFDATKREVMALEHQNAPRPGLRVIGSDVSGKVLSKARTNAASGGVEEACQWLKGDLDEIVDQIPTGAWLVTNPPYGKRLEEGGAVRRLVAICERRRDLRPCALLLGGRAKKLVPGSFGVGFRTKSGGLRVTLRLRES